MAAAFICSRSIATTGALTPSGIVEMGTSPSCLALNAAGTRLYSANETDRVGDDKQGTISAFAVNRTDGQLELLNTVRSGGAGPTYVSVHPGGRHLLVANYFGGSVAVLPILADGRLGDASDVKVDAGTIGPTRATHAPPGSFAVSGHDRTHAHMIQADPSGRFVLHADLGLDKIFVWRFDERARRAGRERSAVGVPSSRRRSAAFSFPPERPLVVFDPGGRLHHRAVRLRLRVWTPDGAADNLDPAARFCRQQFLLRDPGVRRRAVRLRGQPAARQHRDLLGRRRDGRLTFVGEEWTRGNYPRSFAFDPTGRFLYCCNQRGDAITVFRVDRATGALSFTGQYAAVGNPSMHRLSRPRVVTARSS